MNTIDWLILEGGGYLLLSDGSKFLLSESETNYIEFDGIDSGESFGLFRASLSFVKGVEVEPGYAGGGVIGSSGERKGRQKKQGEYKDEGPRDRRVYMSPIDDCDDLSLFTASIEKEIIVKVKSVNTRDDITKIRALGGQAEDDEIIMLILQSL
jgi:hypothetical protein